MTLNSADLALRTLLHFSSNKLGSLIMRKHRADVILRNFHSSIQSSINYKLMIANYMRRWISMSMGRDRKVRAKLLDMMIRWALAFYQVVNHVVNHECSKYDDRNMASNFQLKNISQLTVLMLEESKEQSLLLEMRYLSDEDSAMRRRKRFKGIHCWNLDLWWKYISRWTI